MELGRCVENEPPVAPELPDSEVAVRLASYNLVSVAVCDADRRLLGVVTVDDVLDRSLPANWRQRAREATGG
jgi:Mg/Co/Ni transporter MgtE